MNRVEAVVAVPASVPWRYRTAVKLVLAPLLRWKGGALTLALPDGTVMQLGDHTLPRHVSLAVKDWRFFWRTLTAGDIGMGESYMAGEWQCSDLVELCRFFLR